MNRYTRTEPRTLSSLMIILLYKMPIKPKTSCYYPTAVKTAQIKVQIYSAFVQLFVQQPRSQGLSSHASAGGKMRDPGNEVVRTVEKRSRKMSLSCSFTDKFIVYSSWIISLLLNVLLCSIALYFYLLFIKQLVKINC